MPIFSGSEVIKHGIAQSNQEHRTKELLFRRGWIAITELDSTKHLSMSFSLSTHLIHPPTEKHGKVSIYYYLEEYVNYIQRRNFQGPLH